MQQFCNTHIPSWVGHVVHMGDRRGEYRVLMGGNLMERDNLEDLKIDGRILNLTSLRPCIVILFL